VLDFSVPEQANTGLNSVQAKAFYKAIVQNPITTSRTKRRILQMWNQTPESL